MLISGFTAINQLSYPPLIWRSFAALSPSGTSGLSPANHIDRAYHAGRYARDLRGSPVARDDTNGLPQAWINQFVSIAHANAARVKQMYETCPALLMTGASWDELAIEAAAHMSLVPLVQYLADLGSPVSTCTAVILGVSETVKSAVRRDPNLLRERGAHDLPLLAYTVLGQERPEIAEYLLESGADVSVRGFNQTTLHFAAAKGYVEIAKLLLGHGADVNAVTESRSLPGTPLGAALRQNQTSMVEFLTQRGGR
jgi:hypothetical protein